MQGRKTESERRVWRSNLTVSRMKLLVAKRPITEKVIISIVSQHLPILSSSKRSNYTKWRSPLPVGAEVDQTSWGEREFYGPCKIAEVAYIGATSKANVYLKNDRGSLGLRARVSKFGQRDRCNNEDGVAVRYRSSRSSTSKIAEVAYIGATSKANVYLKNDRGSLGLGARVSKFGQRDRCNNEDGVAVGYRPSRSSTTCRKEEVGGKNDDCYDAILVLAGGQVERGGVPVWVERRLDKALDLQRSNNGVLCKIVCLGGGTPHKAPILSSEGFVIHESSTCAEYLHSRGAPFSHIIKEWGSYDTIGNGYFSLTQHVIPRRWRTLAVVTSDFHMPRTKAVFEWIFGLQGAGLAFQQDKFGFDGVVALTASQVQGFRLDFHSVPDHDVMEEGVGQARLERERRSIENLNIVIQRICKLEDFHEWFHTEHKAYNTEDQHLFGKEEKLDAALLSY